MIKSDPANIARLQELILKCLGAKKIAAVTYLYDQISNNVDDDGANQSPDQLIPAMAAALYNELRKCLEGGLERAYRDGQYYVYKSLKIPKPALGLLDLTIQTSLSKSYDLIKSSFINLCAGLFSFGKIDKGSLKDEIEKRFDRTTSLITDTESMRQKVAGAASALRAAGVEKVMIEGEYLTAGDRWVCPKCRAYDRQVMSIDEFSSLVPQHPNCRCWFRILEVERK